MEIELDGKLIKNFGIIEQELMPQNYLIISNSGNTVKIVGIDSCSS
jgi:hypothetical protein